ncbi:MAG TPA: 4-alpha-glucanotransferase, partial [Chitinophagaceae bacterium]|nr:4-alpha-glucanotransferase [Chitinophagaceae bacterium]
DPALTEGCNVLEQIFFKTPYAGDEYYNNRAIQFYQRCMQFSGPLMAKGVEDTLMYTFNRFVAHNEVGDAPGAFGLAPDVFHQQIQDRQTHWPLALNTTATHDTKRGEDFRARLNVITDVPGVWLETIAHWRQLNSNLKTDGAPDSNDEYFIYQTLAGSYPFDEASEATYSQRLQTYLQKALREAKRHSNWTAPNETYENATLQFAMALLQKEGPFWKSFQKLLHKISDFGLINALAQVVLKYTCPGVPDTYQGSEQWDFNFVDPDNRRPVDYGHLKMFLDAFSETIPDEKMIRQLWAGRHDARIKLFLIQALLRLRNEAPDLFAFGEYVPLKVDGVYKNNVLAFARKYKQDWCVVVVPLHLAALVPEGGKKKADLDWKDTKVLLPKDVKPDWQDVVQARTGKQRGGLLLKTLFKNIPVAVLKMQGEDNKRSAGILMHLTSLPSAFGIGDLGPEATRFADFLQRSHQRYWQLLPINPTENGQGHSPYSSTSSRAGNVLLISPELLVKEGLLTKEQLRQYEITNEGKVDYSTAERVKIELLDWAWKAFETGAGAALQESFEQFKNEEDSWLQPFALYAGLKKLYNGKPWFQWPDAYKNGTPEALQEFEKNHHTELENIKWLQFLFARQWKAFKGYCNARNIQLLGDLPIYVSYDSADVWTNKKLFKLDAEGGRIGMAGVPPDAFSDDGQLWGMPVYDWAVLKEDNYSWWIDRLRKNSQLFDVIRLDHFRAFADYWEVPAGETTAKNGVWNDGPGASFFAAVQAQLGNLPFVAEDLGEINEGVIQLRDAFGLPGMKILQFAFGDDVATSDYMPHNYTPNFIAYTGTHDNNTTRGWFRQEAHVGIKSNLERYVAQPVTEENIAFLLCRMAFSSVAKTAILPIQDVLNLDEQARMNTPASGKNNWGWRLLPGQVTEEAEARLREWTIMYNRD